MGRLRDAWQALTAPAAMDSRYGSSDSVSSDGWFVRMLGGGKTSAGTAVSEYSALYLPVVYACLNRIGNPIANFPLEIRQRVGGGSAAVTEHPMSQRLGIRPNDYMSSRSLRKTTQGHALLWGNGYQEIERNRKGQAVGLWPLLPDRTRPHRVEGVLEYRTNIDGRTFRIDHADVAHVMDLSHDGYIGYSQVAIARRMSVRAKVPTADVDGLQRTLADLRASAAQWVADERFDSLSFTGFYKDFSIDLAVPPTSFCTLTIEGLTETTAGPDDGTDPAPDARASTLQLLQPQTINDGVLTSINVPENDQPVWAIGTTYALGARVIRAHRQWESLIAANLGNEPSAESTVWLDIGPTNRWAMLDDALGTATTNAGSIVATFDPVAAVTALALLDVSAVTVRVQAPGYDRTIAPAASPGMAAFLDMPPTTGVITVTVSGGGTVSVGTLMMGQLVGLGITEASPTAALTDFSRKETDEFGDVTVVERAWAKNMGVRAMLRTDAIDQVFDRIATVRARPCLWIGSEELEALSIYGFFKDFSIEVGESISTLALSVEGLSKAAPMGPGFGAQIEALSGLLTDLAETVDAKRTVFTQPNAPTAAESEENDWWQQTNGSGAIIATYRRVAGTGRLSIGGNAILLGGSYIGLCWAPVDDARIGSALAAATAASNLADSKAVVFTMFASTDPVPTGTDVGDVLVRAYLSPVQMDYWNGSAWQPAATYGATAAQLTTIANALSAAENAQAVADGKVDTYYQTTAPGTGTIGDLWFDTDDGNKLYRHNGSGWAAVQDAAIGAAISAAAGAQATADGKVTTFYSEGTPAPSALGDLWVKISTRQIYRWNGSAWAAVSPANVADGATVGAPAGTNVGGTPATTVESGANAGGNAANGDGTIKPGKVSTGAVQTNAITLPVAAYTAGIMGFVEDTWSTVQSVGITSSGGVLQILASFQLHVARNGPVDNQARLLRDGVVIYGPVLMPYAATSTSAFFDGPFTVQVLDAPAAGSHTYEIQCYRDIGTMDVSYRSLTVVELKR